MPSIAQMDTANVSGLQTPPSMKKRKREYSTFSEYAVPLLPPTPSSTQQLTTGSSTQLLAHQFSPVDHDSHSQDPFYDLSCGEVAVPSSQERILLKPRSKVPRSLDQNKRRRTIVSEDNALSLFQLSSNRAEDDTHAKADLSACHICHKRPRVKTDLDSYADCEGCGRRTCFICMRKCRGESDVDVDGAEMIFGLEASLMDADNGKGSRNEHEHGEEEEGLLGDLKSGEQGHRGVVCSRCSKECGPDGHVRCNGCLSLAWAG